MARFYRTPDRSLLVASCREETRARTSRSTSPASELVDAIAREPGHAAKLKLVVASA